MASPGCFLSAARVTSLGAASCQRPRGTVTRPQREEPQPSTAALHVGKDGLDPLKNEPKEKPKEHLKNGRRAEGGDLTLRKTETDLRINSPLRPGESGRGASEQSCSPAG